MRRDARGTNPSEVYGLLGSDQEADKAVRPVNADAAAPRAMTTRHGAAAVWSRAPKFSAWAGSLDSPSGPRAIPLASGHRPGRAVLRAVWRLAALSILLVAVATAGAYAVASNADKVYAARSEIAFDLRGFGWESSERFLDSQPVIATSRSVLMPIAAAFSIPIQDLEEHLSVDVVGSSGVVRVEFADPSEAQALDVTRAVTARYLAELSAFDRVERVSRWVLTEAFVLDDPIAPQPIRAAALGAFAGLVLAAGVVLLRIWTWSTR